MKKILKKLSCVVLGHSYKRYPGDAEAIGERGCTEFSAITVKGFDVCEICGKKKYYTGGYYSWLHSPIDEHIH